MNGSKITTYQILRNKFPASEYVLMQEVSDDAGHNRSRSLDYMVASMWLSRGLSLIGIEKKSWRGDWLKELKNPQKQENHFKYCNEFYLLTDKENVAKIEEIPETWGWFHINDKGVLKTVKNAPKLNALPTPKGLMVAMLRRAASLDGMIHTDLVESRVEERVNAEMERRKTKEGRALDELQELQSRIAEFEKESGLTIAHPYQYGWDIKKYGKAIKYIADGKLEEMEKRMLRIKEASMNIHIDITAHIKEIVVK